ncbi:hypothetical protein HJ581_0042090 [Rhodococcus opacus]|nr:hypothetical protein HJ581_0042090 [Rhodococcus opacus]
MRRGRPVRRPRTSKVTASRGASPSVVNGTPTGFNRRYQPAGGR